MQQTTQLGLWPDATYSGNRTRHFKAPRPDYQVYMGTEQWQCRRRETVLRQKFRCYDCGCEEPLQVHHVTYAHLGEEWPEDLEALCRSCHSRRHNY